MASSRFRMRSVDSDGAMKIGVFYQDNGPQSRVHVDLARRMIESARRVMPGIEIHHLTDDKSEVLPEVDGVYRIGGNLPMAVRRVTHHGSRMGDWAFVDTDVIFRKDVRDVFDDPFDVALTDRIGTDMEGTPFAQAMPYNMGVTFSRNPLFWAVANIHLKALASKDQQWMGDQEVVCAMARHSERLPGRAGFNIKILPGRIYNYPPASETDDYSHAAIVHFKGGERKRMMGSAS